MINWSKFANPSNNESAHYSDLVYPLTAGTIKAIDRFDHVDRLLSSDILGNADDRRFALSQASTRCNYDFESTKREQIEGAIETLDQFIDKRTDYYSLATSPRVDNGVKQDLAGMARAGDNISEFRISPPPKAFSAKTTGRRSPQPPSPSTTSTTAFSRSKASPTTTAPTSIATTRVSIADLLNSQPTTESPEPWFGDLSPDLNQQATTLHHPSQALLSATLDSIRLARGITRPASAGDDPRQRYRNLASYKHHQEGLHDASFKGRAYRAARMRRSSQTRHKRKDLYEKTPTASAMRHKLHPASAPSSPQSMPDMRSPSVKQRPVRHGPAQLQEWFNTMMSRRSSDSYSDSDSDSNEMQTSSLRLKSITRSLKDDRSGTKAHFESSPQTSTHATRKPAENSTSPQSTIDNGDTSPTTEDNVATYPFTEAYAYVLDDPTARDSGQMPYGYIAGDARPNPSPTNNSGGGGGNPRVGARGRARECGRGLRMRVGSRYKVRDLRRPDPEGSSQVVESADADAKEAEADKHNLDHSQTPISSSASTTRKRPRPTDLQLDSGYHHHNTHSRVQPNTTAIPIPPTIEVDLSAASSSNKRRKTSSHDNDNNHKHSPSPHGVSESSSYAASQEYNAEQLAEIEEARTLAEKWWRDPLGMDGGACGERGS